MFTYAHQYVVRVYNSQIGIYFLYDDCTIYITATNLTTCIYICPFFSSKRYKKQKNTRTANNLDYILWWMRVKLFAFFFLFIIVFVALDAFVLLNCKNLLFDLLGKDVGRNSEVVERKITSASSNNFSLFS